MKRWVSYVILNGRYNLDSEIFYLTGENIFIDTLLGNENF